MIDTIIHTPWGFMRWLRLIFGGIFIYFGITHHDNFSILAGGLFVIQATFNLGCCGISNTCAPKKNTSSNNDIEEVSYEEVKPKE
jgi:hypothetical protein